MQTPTFEEYFKNKDSHLDNFMSPDFDAIEADEEIARNLEAEEDELTYKKELIARLFGGKLTSRQYGVLLGMTKDKLEVEEIMKKNDFRSQEEAKDQIRCAEEIVENFRREKVYSGEWAEEDSYTLMQNTLDELSAKYPTKTVYDIEKREYNKAY